MKTLLLAAFACTAAATVPSHFQVDFVTDVPGTFRLNVTTSLAPHGVDRFYKLIADKFYDESAFYRVVPGFVVQFGIAGTPAENNKWKSFIPDDKVKASNLAGTITYAAAGPNTRATQVFINYIDNARLDGMGFAPFGKVISGMDVATKIFNPTPGVVGGINQQEYLTKGNPWLKENYPKANFIISAKFVN